MEKTIDTRKSQKEAAAPPQSTSPENTILQASEFSPVILVKMATAAMASPARNR